MIRAAIMGAFLCSCHWVGERPACSSANLALIEAQYVEEVLKACSGQTFESCEALAEIEARYEVKREEWIQCQ